MSSNRTTSPVWCYPGEAAEGTRFPENANNSGTGAYEPQRRRTLPNLSVAAETQSPAAAFSDQGGSAEVACFAHRLAQITAVPQDAVNRSPLLRRGRSLTLPKGTGVGASIGVVGLIEPPAGLDHSATAITAPTALSRACASAIQPKEAAERSPTSTEQAPPEAQFSLACMVRRGYLLGVQALSSANVTLRRHLAEVRALLMSYGDANSANREGNPLLHQAADSGNLAAVRILLVAPSVFQADVNQLNPDGDTPLHLAARSGHLEVVEELLAAGASRDIANQAGDTPAHLAARSGHTAVIGGLVSSYFSVHSSRQLPLFRLLEPIVAKLGLPLLTGWKLPSFYPALNGANRDGDTPLHLAIRGGHSSAMRLLLYGLVRARADVNRANQVGDTPLHLAIRSGSSFVYSLLDAHADVNRANQVGDTPLHLAIRSRSSFVYSLLDAHADVNRANQDGDTPLHLAALDRQSLVYIALLDVHADVNSVNRAGDTPLNLAARNGHHSMVDALLRAHADVNNANQDGDTPLHLAARDGHLALVQTLVIHNANVNSTNQAGETPLQLAVLNGHLEVVQLLRLARLHLARLELVRAAWANADPQQEGGPYNLEPIFSLAHWENFAFSEDDPARESFTNFLRQLGVHRRGNGGAPIAPRLEKILECIKQDPEANKDVLSHVIDFGNACQDSALYRLRGMEMECLLWELSSADKSQQSETIECHFIRVLQTVHRRERLQRYIFTYMEQDPGRNDEVEIRLYFEQQLHEVLGFVGEKPNMCYPTIGQVPADDVLQAKETLLQQERDNPDGLRDFMLQERFWRTYLKKRFSDAFTAILADFHAQQEQLEEQAGFLSQDPSLPAAVTTNAFNAKASHLNVQREQAEEELLCKKTDEILERFTKMWREEGAA